MSREVTRTLNFETATRGLKLLRVPKSCKSNYLTLKGDQLLRTYLGRVDKGQSEVYTAPFAKGQSMEAVIQDWDEVLVSIKSRMPSLYAFEESLRSKVGPLSVQQPLLERIPDIKSYYECVANVPLRRISTEAFADLEREFAPNRGIRLRSQMLTVNNMKTNTNSGLPFFTRRRGVTDQVIPTYTQIVDKHVLMNLREHTYMGAAVIGWRGQEGGPNVDDVKQRVVWMFPYSVNINELQVYQPLIQSFQRTNTVPAWVSMEAVDERITKLFDTKGKSDPIICTDFTKFDQHFNENLQELARAVLVTLLTQDEASKKWIESVFPVKYMIPLVIRDFEDGLWLAVGKHGMASGSGGTNVDETLVHRALQYEAARNAGSTLNPNSQCLGDDGLLTYPGITVKDVVDTYTSFGLEMNPDKQYVSSQDCIYLRRWHATDYRVRGVCVGVYSTMRALGRLRYLERFMDPDVWGVHTVALRQLSIIENCKWHPLFHEFVHFCMKRDRYRLGIDIPGFLDKIEEYAAEAINVMPDFLGYTKQLQFEKGSLGGIKNWEVVKYLKSL